MLITPLIIITVFGYLILDINTTVENNKKQIMKENYHKLENYERRGNTLIPENYERRGNTLIPEHYERRGNTLIPENYERRGNILIPGHNRKTR